MILNIVFLRMNNLLDKKGMKETIVISGAGTGIGRAICQELASPDRILILIGRRRFYLEETASIIGGEHMIFQADVSNQDELKTIHERLPPQLNITGIVANAGVGGENQYGENDRWDEIIRTNLTGTYLFTQEFLPYLKRSPSPQKNIAIISSILGKIGVPHYSAYCASKAGLLGLTRSLAAELSQDKILVNAICPGWVDTEMSDEGLKIIADKANTSVSEARAEQMKSVPLGKMSKPSEIAQVVHFLLSNRQSSITGQSIDINNGAWMA